MAAKILCIDDEPDLREDVVEELRDAGFETIEAGDGKAGLDAIMSHKPDLVLCDITMPVMDGHDLLRELRAKHPELAELPFIFLSALADRDHVIAGKKLGADDYLTKPIDYQLMLATIEARLQQIERMEARKQEQLVKVFVAAQNQKPVSSAGGSDASSALRKEAAPATSVDPPQAGGLEASKARIGELVGKSGGTVVAGRVQVIGLEEVKAELGEQWTASAARVTEVAESTIRRRLSSSDVLERTESGEFLICFASLSESEAAFKARSIAREVREKILGTKDIDIKIKDVCEVASEAREIEVAPEEVAGSDDVLDLVMGRLNQAVAAARETERKTMAQIVTNCEVLQVDVSMAKGKEAPIALADFDKVTRTGVQAMERARPASDDLAAEIDILRLGRCAELLCQNVLESQRILVVHLDFSTLDHRRFLDRYLQVCQSVVERSKTHIAFNVRNISKDFLPARIFETANLVRPYCRFILAEMNELSLGNIDPVILQAPILTCNHRNVEALLSNQPEALKHLTSEIHSRKSRLLVYDAPQGEDAKRLLTLGSDFVASRP